MCHRVKRMASIVLCSLNTATLTPRRVSSLLYVKGQVDNSVETFEFLDTVKGEYSDSLVRVCHVFLMKTRLGTLIFHSFSTAEVCESDVVICGTHKVWLMTKPSMCMSP